MTMKIAGITGEFVLPKSLSSLTGPIDKQLVWFGGGIGLTPFLSMLSFLRVNMKDENIAIRFVLSTREPNILLPLIFNTYIGGNEPSDTKSKILITLDIFYSGSEPVNDLKVPVGITLHQHAGRLDADYIKSMKGSLTKGKNLYVCGPAGYTDLVIGELKKIGFRSDEFRTEGFTY
jgi:ferredoxin-NADP reductase